MDRFVWKPRSYWSLPPGLSPSGHVSASKVALLGAQNVLALLVFFTVSLQRAGLWGPTLKACQACSGVTGAASCTSGAGGAHGLGCPYTAFGGFQFMLATSIVWWVGSALLLLLSSVGRTPPPMTVRALVARTSRRRLQQQLSPVPPPLCPNSLRYKNTQEFLIHLVFCAVTVLSLVASLVDCSSHPVQASLSVCFGAHSVQTAMWFAGLLSLALLASTYYSFQTRSAALEGGGKAGMVAMTSRQQHEAPAASERVS